MPTEAISVWQFINDGGLLAVSFLVIWGFMSKRIIPGWAYNELKVQHDRALEIALKVTTNTERATEVLNKIQP